MKLNQDCVRDLLLYLEENLTYENTISINDTNLKNYSSIDLVYTADKLDEAGLINCLKTSYKYEDCPVIIAKSITYNGHQFLDNIRDDKVFAKTKSVLSSFKSVSIEIISETASKVITNLINQQLNS